MTENILPTVPLSPTAPAKKKKPKMSVIAILIIIILTIVLVILGERFITDLNRWFNPAYDQYGSYSYSTGLSYYDYDYTTVNKYDRGDYDLYALLIHTAFAIPILLAAVLLYFFMYYKKKKYGKQIIVWPYLIFSIWMTLHVVFEAFYFLIKQYETTGLYIVLLFLTILLTWLAIYIQKRHHRRHFEHT